MIVGFAGCKGSGKDYAGRTLEDILTAGGFHVRQYKFADPLKAFCLKIFGWTEEHTDGDLKEVPDHRGVIPRVAMQRLGTEWGRTLCDSLWVDYTINKIYTDLAQPKVERPSSGGFVSSWAVRKVEAAIVTDVRFPNEAKALQEMGGVVVFMDSDIPSSGHPSETALADTRALADRIFDNRGKNEVLLRQFLVGLADELL